MTQLNQITLDSQLCFALYTANKKYNHFYQEALAPFNLTYSQYIALLSLYEQAPMTVKELGNHLNLDSGTLTPLLKRLEKQGWVTRTRSTEDERQMIIDLTKMAQQNQADLYNRVTSCQKLLGLTTDQYQALVVAVDKISDQLDLVDADHLIATVPD
ncbi:MarR family winged helix-turn-helix transcriptional regulator [Levilactobacillus bambusae]|uniref:MarR family transcriptional regulator n=1 Tax=Levilactobacillus bambusae TaxID=2024736 RepID=A0A2V1N2C3_9LACO|nr:MarR family transcriptional regulator [Levilactobacillus bambusae]PWG01073.1 MarR family transcriptional regulator [Levilactobacillus bambusae]